jgi:hypothetical protein
MTKKSMTTGDAAGKSKLDEVGHPASERWEQLLAEANFLRFEARRTGFHTLGAAADLKMHAVWDQCEADRVTGTARPATVGGSALIQTLTAFRVLERSKKP